MKPDDVIAEKYRLVRCLGAGGMGEVWEANHAVTQKRVAIKVLNASVAFDKGVRARFLNEARAACRVRHPNIVQVHDVLELPDGAPAMVMDFLDGESLGQKLEREGHILLGDLAPILAPIARAVAAAHALGIVHRDLKPDNLYLERQGDGTVTPKVLDFGIAKVSATEAENTDGALTRTGAFLGTPYYVSPEQAFGEKDLDYRSDIWSLGIIIYECLTGRRPTEADNFGQILKTITSGKIPRLARVRADIPNDVSELVAKMLSPDRTERPELAEVALVLDRHALGTARLAQSVVERPSGLAAAQAADALEATAFDHAAVAVPALAPTLPDVPAPSALASTDGNMGRTGRPTTTPARKRTLAVAAATVAVVLGVSFVGIRLKSTHVSAGDTSVGSASLVDSVAPSAASSAAAIASEPAPTKASATPSTAVSVATTTTPPPSSARGPVATAKEKPAASASNRAVASPSTPPAPSGSTPSVAKLNETTPF